MKKILTLCAAALSLLFLSACDTMDGPSPLDTRASGSGAGSLNPDGLPGDSMFGDGLQERGISGGMGSGFDAEHINPEDIVYTIYFGFDQYAVAAGERGKVKSALEFFDGNPEYSIVLVGHTDWYGTEEYNLLLSDRRAKAVSDYMTSLGASAANIEVIGRGEAGAAPDVAKDSPEARNDRRVDIVKYKH